MPDPRPFEEVRQILVERARQHRNPFALADPLKVESTLAGLDSVEPQAWVEAFSALAAPHQGVAAMAERAGDTQTAAREYLLAYEYWRVARYPAPNSAPKQEAYRASQQLYLKAAYWFDPPLERVWMPFQGRADEGQFVLGDLRKPNGVAPPYPLVIHWGGIDSFKEERRSEPYLAAGLAALAIDMPGVGDAPLDGSTDAERQWDAVFDWIAGRDDLDARRVALHGNSTGGYWAAKLAHTHRDRIRAAVDHGGPAHHAFQPDWIARAQTGEYPFELAETLASAFGGKSYDDWLTIAPGLSLLNQGILDAPSAPLLLVNGVQDSIFPIQDMYVLLEHGTPKSARLFADEAHMGGSQAMEVVIDWLAAHLLA
ncbi:MAG TPA: alpha/beta fold hydrolase [Chloroflexota bacterium]